MLENFHISFLIWIEGSFQLESTLLGELFVIKFNKARLDVINELSLNPTYDSATGNWLKSKENAILDVVNGYGSNIFDHE